MTDEPVDLDARRDRAAKTAAGLRRQRLRQLQADQAASERHEVEMDKLFQSPAESWPEAAAKARYLIELLADAPNAQGHECKRRIAQALDDLARLSDTPAPPS